MNSIREQGQDGCTCAGGQGQGGHGQRNMSPSGFSEEAALEMNLRDVIFFFSDEQQSTCDVCRQPCGNWQTWRTQSNSQIFLWCLLSAVSAIDDVKKRIFTIRS